MNEFKCRGNLAAICDDEDDNQHYHDDHPNHGQWLAKVMKRTFDFPEAVVSGLDLYKHLNKQKTHLT